MKSDFELMPGGNLSFLDIKISVVMHRNVPVFFLCISALGPTPMAPAFVSQRTVVHCILQRRERQ